MKLKNVEIPKRAGRKTKEGSSVKEGHDFSEIKDISLEKVKVRPNKIDELKEGENKEQVDRREGARRELAEAYGDEKEKSSADSSKVRLYDLQKDREFLINNINSLKTELAESFESDSWVLNLFNRFARGINYGNFDMYEWLLGESKSEYVYIKGQISLLERELESVEESIKEITD